MLLRRLGAMFFCTRKGVLGLRVQGFGFYRGYIGDVLG